MSIIVDESTKLAVSGLTGREGSFHGLRNKAYGTDLVAGVTPGKGGQDVEGTPVFDTIKEAVDEAGANTSMIFVPARFAAPAINEAIDSGVETVIAITEGIPVLDMLATYWKAKEAGVRLIGPNCPGVLSPGKANVGIIPDCFFDPGPIGVVSKSGTLTYQIGNELKQAGTGNSSIVGIGGDPIVGSDFIDILKLYEADPDTELIVMVGEIGGDAEERAAEFIAAEITKPVVAYIAGFTAPPGKQMGHAGAIISGSSGTAQAKKDALEAKGVRVGESPTETAAIAVETLRALARRREQRSDLRGEPVRLLAEAAVGDADGAVAGEQVLGVAIAVLLEGGAMGVEFPAVELDDPGARSGQSRRDLVATVDEHVGAVAAAGDRRRRTRRSGPRAARRCPSTWRCSARRKGRMRLRERGAPRRRARRRRVASGTPEISSRVRRRASSQALFSSWGWRAFGEVEERASDGRDRIDRRHGDRRAASELASRCRPWAPSAVQGEPVVPAARDVTFGRSPASPEAAALR